MSDPVGISVVADDSEPLSVDELLELGNALLSEAGKAALTAMRASARPEFIIAKTVTVAEARNIHRLAKEALVAWRNVESTLAELIRETDRTKGSLR